MPLLLLFLLALCLVTPAHASDANPYADELIAAARQQHLAEDAQWLTLLHYRRQWLGADYESLVDSANFFTAADGKYNPQAELEATLRAFFSAEQEGDKTQNPQCRFVARYQWLKQRLHFDAQRLPEQACPRFERWVKAIDPAQVTLIFPAAYLNNPSSMFGHTLLRIDMPQQDERTRIISYAINFAAVTDETNGVLFAVRGLTGGYPGQFSIMPYYEKVREYSDMENRDIWEYQLNFTPEEIQRLLQHAWELGPSWYQYYFFDENCSYQLLTLLDVARPGMNLADHFPLQAIPSDTVQVLLQQPGLLRQAVYRPASRTRLAYRLDAMRGDERALTLALADGAHPALDALAPPRRALVLETAQQALQYRLYRGEAERDAAAARSLALLRERATLPSLDIPAEPPLPQARPDEGHPSARLAVGGGRSNGENFGSLRLRPAYHDLMDPQEGFLEGSQINFLDLEGRYYENLAAWRVERFTVIDIASLAARDDFFQPLSWKIDTGLERAPFVMPGEPLSGYVRGGAGLSYRLAPTLQGYLFGEAALHAGHTANQAPLYTAAPQLGLYWSPAPRWRSHLQITSHHFSAGSERHTLAGEVEQRYTLSREWAVKFSYRDAGERHHTHREGSLALQWYF